MRERNWLNCGAFSRKNFTGMHLEARYDARNERNYNSKVPDWVKGVGLAPRKSPSKRAPSIPEMKYYDGEPFELLQGYLEYGSGPEGGYATKAQAQKNAKNWRESADSKARMVKIGDYYYIYGN